jgi:hypothetical protein
VIKRQQVIDLSREKKIEEIRKLLNEGKEQQKSRKALLERMINKKIPAQPRLFAQLITMQVAELNLVLQIGYIARNLKNVHIEVITNWTIVDLSDSAGA